MPEDIRSLISDDDTDYRKGFLSIDDISYVYPDHETVVFSIRFPDVYLDKDCKIKKFKKVKSKGIMTKKEEENELKVLMKWITLSHEFEKS